MAKNKQLEADVTQENLLVLIESRTMRDQHVYRDEVLEKVKIIPTLPNTVEITTEMAATYYEIPVDTIRTIIKRNREEFNDYGEMRILKGKALKDFKTEVQDELLFKGVNSLTLLNRRGLLRLGMLLTDSEVARAVRNYLLNVEEVSDPEQKRWAINEKLASVIGDNLLMQFRNFMTGH